MSRYEIKDMKKEYAEKAAELFASTYRKERYRVKWLPKKYEDADNIRTIISNIIEDSPGIAVFENGSMIGYIAGNTTIYIQRKKEYLHT